LLNQELLEAYDRHASAFRAAGERALLVLRQALRDHGLNPHALTWRVKERESFCHKIGRPDRTYGALWDVTDVLGLRVSTLFEDEVERVAEVIEAKFAVDLANSTDKRVTGEAARFGYRSVHYVVRLDERLGCEELVRAGARFEIQLRTVLQDAWAEIEHDLGYKAKSAVPEGIRRRFSRVASLLELADDEFVSIRRELAAYAADVDRRMQDPSAPLPLDPIALESLLRGEAVRHLDARVAAILEKPLSDEVFFSDYLLKMLRHAGLRDTAEVARAVDEHGDQACALVMPYFDFARFTYKLTARNLTEVQRGYSLFFLAHVLVLRSSALDLTKVERFAAFYRELDYPNDPKLAQQVAHALVEILR